MPTHLFSPYSLRSVTVPNRIGVSPMCQYTSPEGLAQPWHLVHLGSRAVGGAGLVLTEATSVSPEGRISPHDAGIWNDQQVDSLRPIVDFIRAQGSVAGIQLAHAGRKASTRPPWLGRGPVLPEEGGWQPVAPSDHPFSPDSLVPTALDQAGLDKVRLDFIQATRRSVAAGFQVLEIHMAHGYLLHSFLSPLSNRRSDSLGGTLENRVRFPLQVTEEVRQAWPAELPLLVRISASDWVEGGWTLEDSMVLAHELKKRGVDLIDCSSGGSVPDAKISSGPGYQVAFAQRVRETGIPTAAVGEITHASQAETILATGQADLIFLARELLRDPYWPLRAAQSLGAASLVPAQYRRAFP